MRVRSSPHHRTAVQVRSKGEAPSCLPSPLPHELNHSNRPRAVQVRSKNDAELLYEAKYGKRGEDGKMTREQYAALRRRVGGTAKGE